MDKNRRYLGCSYVHKQTACNLKIACIINANTHVLLDLLAVEYRKHCYNNKNDSLYILDICCIALKVSMRRGEEMTVLCGENVSPLLFHADAISSIVICFHNKNSIARKCILR